MVKQIGQHLGSSNTVLSTLPIAEILSGKNARAWVAVLFSRQLLNGSQDFIFVLVFLFFYFFKKYKTIETHARALLIRLDISLIYKGLLIFSLFPV